MDEIPIQPNDTVSVGEKEYTFTERQGESDVSGIKNYPNKITITVNSDIAWKIVDNILNSLRYHPAENTFNLTIYGQLAEKVEV